MRLGEKQNRENPEQSEWCRTRWTKHPVNSFGSPCSVTCHSVVTRIQSPFSTISAHPVRKKYFLKLNYIRAQNSKRSERKSNVVTESLLEQIPTIKQSKNLDNSIILSRRHIYQSEHMSHAYALLTVVLYPLFFLLRNSLSLISACVVCKDLYIFLSMIPKDLRKVN